MNLLIVDDERHIVTWMRTLLEQHPMGWDIYCAYSAVEALSWMRRTRIDIVITDIRMPGMSGIELMRQIERNWPDCQIIFLTGYSEFDYVYEAISHKQVQYLLKTEEDEVIERAVERAAEWLNERYAQSERPEMSDAQLLQQSEWFGALRKNHVAPEELTDAALAAAGVPLCAQAPAYLLAGQLYRPWGRETFAAECQASRGLYKEISKRLHPQFAIVQGALGENRYGWILQPVQTDKEISDATAIMSYLDLIQQSVFTALDARLSLCLYEAPRDLMALRVDMEAMLCRYAAMDAPVGSILTAREARTPMKPDALLSQENIAGRLQTLPQLRVAIEDGDSEALKRVLSALLEGMENAGSMRDLSATQLYMNAATALYNLMLEKSLFGEGEDALDWTLLAAPAAHGGWPQAKAYLVNAAEKMLNLSRDRRRSYTESVMITVCSYIDAHPEEDLSLIALAERVAYNPSYLSRAFKRYMGVKLNQYITDVRMKKAQELLKSSFLTVSEIAERVGFDNAQYFSTAFKRVFHETPQAFRERTIGG